MSHCGGFLETAALTEKQHSRRLDRGEQIHDCRSIRTSHTVIDDSDPV